MGFYTINWYQSMWFLFITLLGYIRYLCSWYIYEFLVFFFDSDSVMLSILWDFTPLTGTSLNHNNLIIQVWSINNTTKLLLTLYIIICIKFTTGPGNTRSLFISLTCTRSRFLLTSLVVSDQGQVHDSKMTG